MIDTPRSIRAQLGPKALSHAGDLFDHRARTIFSELFQNSRRAGATHIDVIVESVAPRNPARERKDTRIVVTDNGSGIASPEALLTFGGSAWSTELDTRERAAGMGFYSLAARGVTVSSQNWTATISPAGFIGDALVDITLAPAFIAGTRLEFQLEDEAHSVARAIEDEAYFLPISVKANDKIISQVGFLDGAVATSDLLGVRFGVFVDPQGGLYRKDPNLNFYGHAICTTMPTESESAPVVTAENRQKYGGAGRSFVVRADIIDAPDLRLVLPTRNTVIENDALAALRTAGHRFLFETIAALGDHMLSPAQLARAKALGVDLAAPRQILIHAWTAAQPDDTVIGDAQHGSIVIDPTAITAPENTYLFPLTDELQSEAQLGRAIEDSGTDLPFAMVRTSLPFAGFPGFDAIPHATASYEIRSGDKQVTVGLNDTEDVEALHKALGLEVGQEHWGLVDSIELVLAIPGNADAYRVALDVFVESREERGCNASGVMRRGASPEVVADRIIDITWSWDDDDENSARNDEYDILLAGTRTLLLPPGDAHAKTVYDALRSALAGLLYSTATRPAVQTITVAYNDATHSSTMTVTLADGTSYTG